MMHSTPRRDRRRPPSRGAPRIGGLIGRGPRLVAIAVALLSLPPVLSAAEAPRHPQEDTRGDLERIELWLSADDPDRRAAALRELDDRIGLPEIEELHRHLGGTLDPAVRAPLLARLHELARTRLREVEASIESFETARRLARALLEELALVEEPDPDRVLELDDRRRSRREARARVEEGRRSLRALGLALAPVLWHHREAGGTGSPLVARFGERLWDDLVREARRLYPLAPGPDAIGAHESRSLVPLIDTLEEEDPAGWDRRRADVLREAHAAIATLRPDEVDHGRALLLELGEPAQAALDARIDEDGSLPRSLRARIAEWNRLRVPPGFERRTALPLGRYSLLSPPERRDLIHRLENLGPAGAPAVLNGILRAEDDVALKVEAAAVLARLGDPRGAGFLRELGLERAVELVAISRRVLLIEALERRSAGDEQGALDALLEILRRFPGDFRLHYEIGFSALRLRQLELSIEHFERAVAFDTRDPLAHYNLACAHALAEHPEEALDELSRAIEGGFNDSAHILEDPDLASLRELPRFRELVDALRDE